MYGSVDLKVEFAPIGEEWVPEKEPENVTPPKAAALSRTPKKKKQTPSTTRDKNKSCEFVVHEEFVEVDGDGQDATSTIKRNRYFNTGLIFSDAKELETGPGRGTTQRRVRERERV